MFVMKKNKYSRVISNLHAIQDTACWLLHFRMGMRDVFLLYTWTESSQVATASLVQCGCHARHRTELTAQNLVCDTAVISLSPLSYNTHHKLDRYWKGKFFPGLNSTTCHEEVWESGDRAPHLDDWWGWLVNLMPSHLIPGEGAASMQWQWTGGWVDPRESWGCGE
jgi:hypothetical protein